MVFTDSRYVNTSSANVVLQIVSTWGLGYGIRGSPTVTTWQQLLRTYPCLIFPPLEAPLADDLRVEVVALLRAFVFSGGSVVMLLRDGYTDETRTLATQVFDMTLDIATDACPTDGMWLAPAVRAGFRVNRVCLVAPRPRS
jgi:hypothetical protein